MDADNRSFSQLFVDYHKKFVRFATSYVRDLPTAEDIVSDAIIYYWENRIRLPADTNVPAYLLTAIKNKCLNHLQHLRVKENAFTEIQTHAQWDLDMRVATLAALEPTELYTKEMFEMVDKALRKLPEKTQLIFCKSRFDQLSNKEISLQLDISIKTVEAHITTALKILHKALGDYLVIIFLFIN
jgi:RNA polymerase sigma-70 factor (ECF subfamily)